MRQKKTEQSVFDWVKFGEWMRQRRERKGLSQEAAADKVGIHRQTWYRLENGASTKYGTMLKIARFLAADEADLNRLLVGVFEPLSGVHGEVSHKETVEEALDDASFFERKGLSEDGIAELRPYLQILDREVERVQKKKFHIASREDMQNLADELANGGPFVRKPKKDELVTNSDIAHKPKKGKKT
jgi:transcriptional regulator with XRE-family HTH domain